MDSSYGGGKNNLVIEKEPIFLQMEKHSKNNPFWVNPMRLMASACELRRKSLVQMFDKAWRLSPTDRRWSREL